MSNMKSQSQLHSHTNLGSYRNVAKKLTKGVETTYRTNVVDYMRNY